MSVLSALPVRQVFRALVALTLVLLLCVVAAVTISYRSTRDQRHWARRKIRRAQGVGGSGQHTTRRPTRSTVTVQRAHSPP